MSESEFYNTEKTPGDGQPSKKSWKSIVVVAIIIAAIAVALTFLNR